MSDPIKKDGDIAEEDKRKAEEDKSKAERDKLLQELQQKDEALKKSEQVKTKLEGVVEAIKIMQAENAKTGQQEWTPQQWEAFEQKTGMTKDQLIATGSIVRAELENARKEFESRIKETQEKAQQSHARLEQLENEKTFESVIRDFLTKKPALARYENDVREFLADYPDGDRQNKDKLKKILDKAEIYVKGKVGDKSMKTNNTSGGVRFSEGEGDTADEQDEKVDISGMEPFEQKILSELAPSKEKNEIFKKYYKPARGGVVLSLKEEFQKK